MTNSSRIALSLGCLVLLVLGVVGSAPTSPELEVLTHNLTSEVVKNDANEDDWSYVYTVRVRNIGQAGQVRVKGRITTPQGQFYREQIIRLDADQTTVIRFVYTEPNFIIDLLRPEERSKYEFSYDVIP